VNLWLQSEGAIHDLHLPPNGPTLILLLLIIYQLGGELREELMGGGEGLLLLQAQVPVSVKQLGITFQQQG